MKFGRRDGWKEINFCEILTRQELVNKLFDEFDKNENSIRTNLTKWMNEIYLETNNKDGKLSVTIKYERKYADGKKYSKSKNN